ncbi:hypothetical protein L7F22_003442 [Adiantum nelumboides]|nr:hypothetical protein [Adiantum nelumboides]
MSMIGHILGLGDRHLDNIMMDFCTGDIMHIDYNVCFEKGLRLKIPEIVPFRLTQTVQAALGLTGVEGTFRQTCENVLDTLQQNKDVILMLLDVFIWDPLTEWTKNDGGHEYIQIWKDDKKGKEVLLPLSQLQLQEERPMMMEEAASQEAKSQEDSVSCRALELIPTRNKEENLEDTCGNLGEFIDEHILSQAENDCWISPPSSDLGYSSDKEAENPTDFYWPQSADSLSGSRNWQRAGKTDLPQQKDGEEGMPELLALELQEKKAEDLDLLSQGGARVLEKISTNLDETKVSLNSNRRQKDLQTPISLDGAPFHSPSDPYIGASTDFSNGLDTGQTSRDVRQMQPSVDDTQTVSRPEASTKTSPKRNPYAVSVLEKIQWKLSGLDYESRRHSTVSEQVDHLLRQAMSIENLCNMYEGSELGFSATGTVGLRRAGLAGAVRAMEKLVAQRGWVFAAELCVGIGCSWQGLHTNAMLTDEKDRSRQWRRALASAVACATDLQVPDRFQVYRGLGQKSLSYYLSCCTIRLKPLFVQRLAPAWRAVQLWLAGGEGRACGFSYIMTLDGLPVSAYEA